MKLLIVISLVAGLQLSWAQQQDVTITNPLQGVPESTLQIVCAVYTTTDGERQLSAGLRTFISLRSGVTVFRDSRLSEVTNDTHKIFELENLMPSDTGTSLNCAVNDIASPPVTIQVLFRPNITRDSPSNDVIVTLNGSFAILFNVSGNPPAVTRVERGDSSAPPNSIIASGSSVVITNPGVNDGGRYRFIATNSAGMDYMNFTIIVQFAPIFSEVPSSEGIRCDTSGSVYMCAIMRGSSGSLNCTFQSNPEGSINYTVPTNSSSTQLIDGIISLSSASSSEAGEYTCRAQNEVLGMTRNTTRTFVLYVGEPPVPVETSNPMVTDDSVVLSWTYSGNNDIPISFNISIEALSTETQVITEILPVTQTSYTVPLSNLQPNSNYRATIRAVNLLDSGQGRDVTFITPEMSAVPTSTPGTTKPSTGSAERTTVTSLFSIALLLLCITALL